LLDAEQLGPQRRLIGTLAQTHLPGHPGLPA
jgi:hypothetical protein